MNDSTIDQATRARLDALIDEGQRVWRQFDAEVRSQEWHPFMPADYRAMVDALIPLRQAGARFLEWGSATGVITIAADMLGFEACGIEIDGQLVEISRRLAAQFDSNARFATGSFLPDDYEWRNEDGDPRLGTLSGTAPAGYAELGLDLDDFDLVFGYPWSGEEPIMRDLMKQRGAAHARLMLTGRGGPRIVERADL